MPKQETKRYWTSIEERDRAPHTGPTANSSRCPPAATGARTGAASSWPRASAWPARRYRVARGRRSSRLSRCSRSPRTSRRAARPCTRPPAPPARRAAACSSRAATGGPSRSRESRTTRSRAAESARSVRRRLLACTTASDCGAPTRDGRRISWDDVDRTVLESLDWLRRQGGSVRVLSGHRRRARPPRRRFAAFPRTFADGGTSSTTHCRCRRLLDAHATDARRPRPAALPVRARRGHRRPGCGLPGNVDLAGRVHAGYRQGRTLDGDDGAFVVPRPVRVPPVADRRQADRRVPVAPAEPVSCSRTWRTAWHV